MEIISVMAAETTELIRDGSKNFFFLNFTGQFIRGSQDS